MKPDSRLTRFTPLLLWILPAVFLGLFFYVPLGTAFSQIFQWRGATGGITWQAVWEPLRFTIWQAGLSTLLTLMLGLPSAYLFGRLTFPGKSILRVLVTLPFLLPTVVVAAGFFALLGPSGWVNQVLMVVFNLNHPPLHFTGGLAAILLAHVFYNTSVVIRVVGGAWAGLDPRFEQAGSTLGASRWRVLKEITLPLLQPAILAAGLLVFLFNFTSFGVILMLGGPGFATLEVEIYYQTLFQLNLPLAGLLALVQLSFTAFITWLAARMGGGQNLSLLPRFHGEGIHPPGGKQEKVFLGVMAIFLVLLLVSPLIALVGQSFIQFTSVDGVITRNLTLRYYTELFQNSRNSVFYVPPIQAAANSFLFGLITVSLSLPLGLLAVYALRQKIRLRSLLEMAVMLPLGTSAVTLGLGYLLVFNHPPLDIHSFPLLIPLAHSLVAFPFVLRILQPASQQISEGYRQSARVLGASPLRAWWEVDLPLLLRPLAISAVYAFTISLGEFGATSFLARPETPTLPIAIFRFFSIPGALNYGQALAMATLLLAACALALILLEKAAS